jgi:hypothetical protein
MSAHGIEHLLGTFVGKGRWHDSVGQSQSYHVQQTNRALAGGLELSFKHDFEDGSIVSATFALLPIAPALYRLEVADAVVGNGYLLDDYCHYHLKTGDAFVEASYRGTDDRVRVYGSSTKNADGNYIAWHEMLIRVAQLPAT